MKKITFLFLLLAVSLGYSQNLLTNGDFEAGAPGTPWYGNALNPVDDGSGTNFVNEANVGAAGNPWDVNVSQNLTLVDGETYTLTYDAYTATGTTRTIVVGIGEAPGGANGANVVTETLTDAVTTFTHTLDANYGSAATSRVIFDLGAETGFVFIDNVSLELVGGAAPTCTDGIMNGDETGVDCGGTSCAPCATASELLTNGDFEAGAPGTPWYGNALNPVDDGSGTNFVNEANIGAAGNPWDVNVSQNVTLVDGETYTLTFDAYTATGTTRTMVVGIGEAPGGANGANVVTETLTDAVTTFTYTLDANYGSAATSRVIFDMGAETGFVFIDNVSLKLVGGAAPTCTDGIMNGDETGVDCGGTSCAPCTPATGLLVNGDFEDGVPGTPWYGNALNPVDDGSGSNFVNEANVGAAGNPWDVNVSQNVTLVDGETYTFTYDAYTATGTTRTMVVGIGEAPGGANGANVVTETLTDALTTFTHTLVANYGAAATSRVIFDLGADTGFVFIDNVSLTVAGPPVPTCTDGIMNGDETGIDCGGTSCGPCAAPVAVVLEDFDGTAPTTTADTGVSASVSSSQSDSAPNSLEILTDGAGDPWQGVKLLMQDHKIDMTTADKTLTVDVYSMAPREYLVKLSNGDANPAGDNPALESKTAIAHPGGGWVTLTADFNVPADTTQPGYNPPNDQFSSVVFFPLYNIATNGWNPVTITTSYLDNITGIEGDAITPPGPTCTDGIQNGDEEGVDCGGTSCAPCAMLVLPTTAPPTPPARAAADVISIYGTAYGTAVGLNNVPWDGNGTVDSNFVEETIAGNEVLKIDFVDFLGADLGSVTDASAMTYFHMDYWIADAWTAGQVFNQKLSNHSGGAGETDAGDLTIALPGDGSLNQTWVSLDIPLTEAAGWVNAKGLGIDGRDALAQYLITVAGTIDVAFVDNIYLHKNTTLSTDKFDLLGLEAYPNPTNGNWNLKTNKENIETVEVFNMLGKSVLRMSPNASSISIDASRLPSGLYLAKIASKTKSQTIKLVRN